MANFYPMRLSGISKDTIWGGAEIKRTFGVDCGDKTGELWVLTARRNEDSRILNGEFEGMRITEFLGRFMPKCLPFPLLIKFIDSNDRLSVQVHPDDDLALALGDNAAGKTEMWHIISAEEGTSIVYGIKDGIDKKALRTAVEDGCVEDVLNYVPVKAGDTFFIPAGLVHAIGKGILLAEVQQNSDTTFRFYDYGRLDANGNPRELHIEKAFAATKIFDGNETSCRYSSDEKERNGRNVLADCQYFKVEKMRVRGNERLCFNDADFYSLVCISGECELTCDSHKEIMSAGNSFFVPHGTPDAELSGDAEIIISIPRNSF